MALWHEESRRRMGRGVDDFTYIGTKELEKIKEKMREWYVIEDREGRWVAERTKSRR